MKSLIYERYGVPAEVLCLHEQPKPVPGPGEVLIRWIGSPIHPVDILRIRGLLPGRPLSGIAGTEGAGYLEEAGPGVTLPKGTLLAFSSGQAWAEYVLAPASAAVALPGDFPPAKAVQFLANPTTAWGLLEQSGVMPDDWLLVTAGRATVSGMVTQLAVSRGIRVILTVRQKAQRAALEALGAAAVLDVSDGPLEEQVLTVTGGHGADAVLDAVGGDTGTSVLASLAPGGRLIAYGALEGKPSRYDNRTLLGKGLSLSGYENRRHLSGLTPEAYRELTDRLIPILASPAFSLPVAAVFPLAQYREALAFHADPGRQKGKVLLQGDGEMG